MKTSIPKDSSVVDLSDACAWFLLEDMSVGRPGPYHYYDVANLVKYCSNGWDDNSVIHVLKNPSQYVIFKDCGV